MPVARKRVRKADEESDDDQKREEKAAKGASSSKVRVDANDES